MTEFIEDEVVYWIDPTNGDIWERSGGCSQCGDCCDDNENVFAVIDGNGDPNPLTPEVHGKCAYFKVTEEGKSFCTGRDTYYYNNGCKFLPSKPNHIINWPNCTYKFTKIN